jgi:hypothetical protein
MKKKQRVIQHNLQKGKYWIIFPTKGVALPGCTKKESTKAVFFSFPIEVHAMKFV